MEVLETTILSQDEWQQINHLWNEEYPVKLVNRFQLLLEGADYSDHYIIKDDEYNIIAWAVLFEKEGEKRFSLIVHGAHKRRGLGKRLVESIKATHDRFYGWVIDHNEDRKANGELYTSPLGFYQKLNFEILYNERIDTDIIRAVKIKWNNQYEDGSGADNANTKCRD